MLKKTVLALLAVGALIACGVYYTVSNPAWWIPSVEPAARATPKNYDASDPAVLPLGNGHFSFEAPAKGDLFFCDDVRFFDTGSDIAGPWVDLENGVFRPAEKPTVRGRVMWPEAEVSFEIVGDLLKMVSNNLPDHPTGEFPIEESDPAFAYDPNPNAIEPQDFRQNFPLEPKIADEPSCLSLEPIAYLLDGVAVFSGMDTKGRDAAAYEIQDLAGAHPGLHGTYHYHVLYDNDQVGTDRESNPDRQAKLLGYALDGFGLYSQYESGEELLTADLDECHGHESAVEWRGERKKIYHYHVTRDFPYTIGCFKGELAE